MGLWWQVIKTIIARSITVEFLGETGRIKRKDVNAVSGLMNLT